ncbi:MAG TPA: IS630 family transposase [Bryobacteraceae bacterium]
MWKPAKPLRLREQDRVIMEEFLRCGTTPQRVVFRMYILLGSAEGLANNQLAAQMKTTRATVIKWRQRYQDRGLEGVLEDAPRSGRKKAINEDKERAIVKATLETKPANGTHWSTRSMATVQGVSDTTIQRIWRAHRLQPHRVEKFKFSKDPQFTEKLRDVVGLYMNPPEKALVLSVDEKSQIQALDRTQPLLPMRPGIPERQTHDYERYGTTTLFAALNVLDGTVIGQCQPRHRHQEFVKFLEKIDRSVPRRREIHLILDNYGTHTHADVKEWLTAHPRYHAHFTPTGASWLNLVERFFAEITDRRIRRGTFRSVPELVQAIATYIRQRNRTPRAFVWTAKPAGILRKIKKNRSSTPIG